jgi:hypothetical protein
MKLWVKKTSIKTEKLFGLSIIQSPPKNKKKYPFVYHSLTWTSQYQTGLLKFSLKTRSGKYKISLLSNKIIDIIQIASPSLPTDRNQAPHLPK